MTHRHWVIGQDFHARAMSLVFEGMSQACDTSTVLYFSHTAGITLPSRCWHLHWGWRRSSYVPNQRVLRRLQRGIHTYLRASRCVFNSMIWSWWMSHVNFFFITNRHREFWSWMWHERCSCCVHRCCIRNVLHYLGRKVDLTGQIRLLFILHTTKSIFPPQVCQGTSHIFRIGPRLWSRLGFRSIVENRGKGTWA